MLIGKDKAVSFIKMNEAPFWRIRRSENSPYIFTALGNASLDESIKRLAECIDYLEPGNYFLECSQKEADNRGAFKTPLRLGEAGNNFPQQYPMQGINAIGSIAPNEVQQKIDEAITRERERMKLEKLEEENKRLQNELHDKESELNSFMVQIGKKLEPYIGTIMGTFMPAAPVQRIAGLPKQKQPVKQVNMEQAENIAQRAEQALDKWVDIDPNCIELLEKIVKLAETNPAMYEQAKSLLNNMVK